MHLLEDGVDRPDIMVFRTPSRVLAVQVRCEMSSFLCVSWLHEIAVAGQIKMSGRGIYTRIRSWRGSI